MSLLYNFVRAEDGSYHFTSKQGNHYLIYFSEYTLPDSDNNTHIVYNIGFSRDGKHSSQPFIHKYDGKIRFTLMSILNDFFKKNDHKVVLFFCFGDDGYSRHRNIVFNQWCKDLDKSIEKYDGNILYEDDLVYGSLIIVRDNPLKYLIINAFYDFLKEL